MVSVEVSVSQEFSRRRLSGWAGWTAVLIALVAVAACGSAESPEPGPDPPAPAASSALPEGAPALPDSAVTSPALADGDSKIATYAGNGSPRFGGEGGPAQSASFYAPHGLVLDHEGNMFITADSRILRVDGATRILSVVAGTGRNKSAGDGGPALEATLREPKGITLDGAGNLYWAEMGSHLVRKLDASSGIVTTVAGGGIGDRMMGLVGDGKTATEALVREPIDVAVDGEGNIFIAASHRIRKVDAATGIIESFAGNGDRRLSGDGGPAAEAEIAEPESVTLDAQSNLFFADADNHRVRKVDGATGIISTIAGIGKHSAESGGANHNEVTVGRGGTGYGWEGDGGPATAAMLNLPGSIAIDSEGNIFIADGRVRVRKVDANTGVITTVIADETASSNETGRIQVYNVTLGTITTVVVGRDGTLYLADLKKNLVHRVAQ